MVRDKLRYMVKLSLSNIFGGSKDIAKLTDHKGSMEGVSRLNTQGECVLFYSPPYLSRHFLINIF